MKKFLTMRLHLLSDLHTEFDPFEIPDTAADVIILAGDIGTGTDGIAWACRQVERLGKPVVYIPGNHEYYHGECAETETAMREAAAACGVHYLNNESTFIGNVQFLGATLWSDYRAPGYGVLEDIMAHCRRSMADHSLIQYGERRFLPQDALELHKKSAAWLEAELVRESSAMQKVVITHHAPSLRCANPGFGLDMTSGSFVSDLEYLMPYADLWCYGHTHHCFDEEILGSRVVSNQRGYPFEGTGGFDPGKVIEIQRSAKSERL